MDHTPPQSATPPDAADLAGGPDVLREELAKWRERVPKLASALRQRAEEAESLRRELERLRAGTASAADADDSGSNAGVRARDALIGELEAKLSELADRHKNVQGELHTRQLTIDELRSEADGWKRKWQEATQSLDEQDDRYSARDRQAEALEQQLAEARCALAGETEARGAAERALAELREERDALSQRNEQLFETTEMANRQIGSLTDSLTGLRAELKTLRAEAQEAGSERDALRHRVAELESARESLQQQLGAAEAAMEEQRDTHARALADESDARQAALAEQQQGHEAELARLREEHSAARDAQAEALDGALRARDEARREAAEAAAQATQMEAEFAARRHAGADAEQQVAALHEELHLVSAAAAFGLQAAGLVEQRLAAAQQEARAAAEALAGAETRQAGLLSEIEEERAETARLAEVVDTAQRRHDERERERRELAGRVERAESRARHLEEQLEERSALVVNLEHQQTDLARREAALERQRDELEEALIRAERHVKENAEHVTALDDRLERQKELMDNLEAELAEAREEHSRALKDAQHGAAVETDRLQAQIQRLEGELRERTEALKRTELLLEEAQTNPASDPAAAADLAAAADPAAAVADTGEVPGSVPLQAPEDGDGKLLLVLNQQLAAERARNEELAQRLQALEDAADARAEPAADAGGRLGDDLTRIHGVGQKLAEQLNDLGIRHYHQIAGIEPDQLEDEGHVLYPHRSRIVRDGWIEQAVKLIRH